MCGIAAICGKPDKTIAEMMLKRIGHRGPDGHGWSIHGPCILGHVRLSILDIEGGRQPMTNERGDLFVSFNGEIYNHLELRRKMEERHRFRTRADTEVLLHLYEEEGEDMLAKLDGMFAFALLGSKGLLLARDAVGIKPLYYGWKRDLFIAASEMKAFPPMDDMYSLPAGHALFLDASVFRSGRKSAPRPKLWRFAPPFPPEPNLTAPPLDEALGEIRRRLEQAVVKRLMSDVPVGVLLSGGLDSSLIAALMRPYAVQLHSFTAGMKSAPDRPAAREMAAFLKTEHHELVYSKRDILNALPEVIRHLESFDAPLIRSAVPMYFISKVAARNVKVVLAGEGADELFAGYEYLARIKKRSSLAAELAAITDNLQSTNLQRADRMSMAHGLEVRVPFLDTDLVRYVYRLPAEWVRPQAGRMEKWLLREACRGLIPPAAAGRKKMKFSEGTGSAQTLSEIGERAVSQNDFLRMKEVAPGVILRSREEMYYYRIWREVLGANARPEMIGRTLDLSAGVKNQRPHPEYSRCRSGD